MNKQQIRAEAMEALERIRITLEATGDMSPVVRVSSAAKAAQGEGMTRKRRSR